jgi:hypothetical protein
VLGENYGEAGAIDYFRGEYDLPRTASGHNSYWFWGFGGSEPAVVIAIGGFRNLSDLFESVEEAGRTSCRWCMPYEKDLPVYICRGLKQPLGEVWPRLRFYI